MKKLLGIFVKGIFTLAPIALTLYILYLLYQLTDGIFEGLLRRVGVYFPGIGFLATIIIIFLAGLLASYWLTNKLFRQFDRVLLRVPLFGSIYGIIKDTVNSFAGNKNSFSRLVRVNMPGGLKFLGFLTNDEVSLFIPEGYVAVYLMQSMQWAGNLVLVPQCWVEPVEVSAEDALKFVASAGLLRGKGY